MQGNYNFKLGKILDRFDLISEKYKNHKYCQALCSQAAQQVLISVAGTFNLFKTLNKKYKQGELTDISKLPKYQKTVYALVKYSTPVLKLINGRTRFSLVSMVKLWFGIEAFWLNMPSNLDLNNTNGFKPLPT
jgi:hypothetical protein